jgi:GMP synthase-like glutamine amidotransferase
MRLGVLQAGSPPASLQPRFGSYGDMFKALLGPAYDWRVYDIRKDDWPAAPTEQDAWLVTGSSAGVYDGEAWIGRLLDFLREGRGRVKMVGVCFGHQALAQAFGGQVIKSPKGWGVGLHAYEVTQSEPWMDEGARIAMPASHQDQVVEPPSGARVLAASAFTPYAMLDYPGDGAISIQPHPEFDPAYAAALIEARRGTRFDEAEADAAVASLQRPNDNARVGGWIGRFLAEG